MKATNTNIVSLSAILASIDSIPMTLESGLSFNPSMTTFLMKNSPFFVRPYNGDSIELVNANGDWLLRTSFITEAHTFDNGYCCFVTASNHKYQFCEAQKQESTVAKFPLAKPEKDSPKLYASFDKLPSNNRAYFEDHESYYFNNAARMDNKVMAKMEAKRADYGFVDGTFAHISDCNDAITDLTCCNGDWVIGETIETRRGEKLVNYTFNSTLVALYKEKAKKMYVEEENSHLLRRAERDYQQELKNYNTQKDIWGQFGFCAIDTKREVQNRAYMDYKSIVTYTFSRPISKGKFVSFLKALGCEIKDKGAWYENYSVINGNGDTWVYTWVEPSTH